MWLLGEALESNVVPVEVRKQGMVHIRHIVFHTAIQRNTKDVRKGLIGKMKFIRVRKKITTNNN